MVGSHCELAIARSCSACLWAGRREWYEDGGLAAYQLQRKLGKCYLVGPPVRRGLVGESVNFQVRVAVLGRAYCCSCCGVVAAMLDHLDSVSESAYVVSYCKQRAVVVTGCAGRYCAEPVESDGSPKVLNVKDRLTLVAPGLALGGSSVGAANCRAGPAYRTFRW
jgi:hypothetical protein